MPMLRTAIIAALSAVLLGFGALSASAMTITPPEFNFTANPGDEIRDVLVITNEDPYAVDLQPTLYNFAARPGDETSGIPDFYAADEERDGHGLAPWITLESGEPFTLAPKERVNIPFTIKVPDDAQPGSRFAAIHLGTVGTSKEGVGPEIGILARASSMILLRVTGDARDGLGVRGFTSDKRAYASLPIGFSVRVENSGSAHLRPTGNIFITDAFGRQVGSIKVNPEFRSVLPGSIRRYEANWSRTALPADASAITRQFRGFGFGRYTATLVLNFGAQNQVVTSATDFWVIPWIPVVTGLIALLGLVFGLRWGVRAHERAVIRRYESLKNR